MQSGLPWYPSAMGAPVLTIVSLQEIFPTYHIPARNLSRKVFLSNDTLVLREYERHMRCATEAETASIFCDRRSPHVPEARCASTQPGIAAGVSASGTGDMLRRKEKACSQRSTRRSILEHAPRSAEKAHASQTAPSKRERPQGRRRRRERRRFGC